MKKQHPASIKISKKCLKHSSINFTFLSIFLCGMIFLTGGCATSYKLEDYKKAKKHEDMRFWASKADMAIAFLIINPIPLLDLPFSLAADIIMFPIDQYFYSVNVEPRIRKKRNNESPEINDLARRRLEQQQNASPP